MVKFFAFIPARAGSKRIINKNLVKIKNKPLIYYSINASLRSKYISKTILYSDSIKIQKFGKKFGAEINYKRPRNISKDSSSMYQTLSYFFSKNKMFKSFDYLVLLQPTSPQRNTQDINNACKMLLKNKKADGLVSTFLIKKMKKDYPNKFMIKKKNYLKIIDRKKSNDSTKNIYLRNGPAILILKVKAIKKNLYDNKLLNFVMPEKRSIDLNTIKDLKELKKIF